MGLTRGGVEPCQEMAEWLEGCGVSSATLLRQATPLGKAGYGGFSQRGGAWGESRPSCSPPQPGSCHAGSLARATGEVPRMEAERPLWWSGGAALPAVTPPRPQAERPHS